VLKKQRGAWSEPRGPTTRVQRLTSAGRAAERATGADHSVAYTKKTGEQRESMNTSLTNSARGWKQCTTVQLSFPEQILLCPKQSKSVHRGAWRGILPTSMN